jgi:hypothetical protein
VGVVKTRGGVPSTYNLGTSESVRENQNLGASPTTASGRVKLVVSSSRLPLGKIGAGRFRATLPLASLRARGRFRAAATDPKVVRAELVDLPPDENAGGESAAGGDERRRRRRRARGRVFVRRRVGAGAC